MRSSFLLPFVALATAGLAGGIAATPERPWPVQAKPAVSSNFCEYREGHLHAGIDVRTFGRVGVPCVAGDDGFVSRIRAAPDGYGKAIYLQLATGETLVYAHLIEFAPPLEEALYEEQTRQGKYRVDKRFPAQRFAVRRGEVIAYSGATGTSAPHLHFEVRNESEHPLDPFAYGFAIADKETPVFQNVVLMPLSPAAGPPREFSAARDARGDYALCDTIDIVGEMGVAVEVYDRIDSESGKLAPAAIDLFVDGDSLAHVAFDAFSFAHTDQVDFVYEVGMVRRRKDYFFQLFHRHGETLWGRHFVSDGRLEPGAGGVREVRIVARDRAGNESTLRFCFRRAAGEGERLGACEVSRRDPGDAGGWYFENFARLDAFATIPPSWSDTIGRSSIAWDGHSLTAGMLSGVPLELPQNSFVGAPSLFLAGAIRGQSRALAYPALDFELIVGERSLYEDAILLVREWQNSGAPVKEGELLARSRAIDVGPHSLTLAADLEIRFVTGQYDSSAAIYRLNETSREWVYYASLWQGEVLSTTAKLPGVYRVLSDRVAPRIRVPFVAGRLSYASGRTVPEVIVPLDDSGSGVDDERTTASVGGRPVIARWDGNEKKLFVELREPRLSGPQVIAIVAHDRAGNRAELETTVDISAPRDGN